MYGEDTAKEIIVALINNNKIETAEAACDAFEKIVRLVTRLSHEL